MYKAKITVIETMYNQDLVDEYLAAEDKAAGHGPCEYFKEDQSFILTEPNMPEGFCSWAWADIQRDVLVIISGGSISWFNRKNMSIVCCTDALRPVVFKIERV